ncbi:hypothetical protein AVEN_129279-1 [Araneus ventricosus]|uniref:Uncharacterized protein n=1 Tax=Araneus ventricosus TaxID=182803 RepID=A0A4Y2P9W7_ARAVE|nr:hypothetical protein AVEN_13936-1 [Araneus ventricosus]GBN48762.1 hypothetical protein AVEN_129279-1 [Araneus ventricosus]
MWIGEAVVFLLPSSETEFSCFLHGTRKRLQRPHRGPIGQDKNSPYKPKIFASHGFLSTGVKGKYCQNTCINVLELNSLLLLKQSEVKYKFIGSEVNRS